MQRKPTGTTEHDNDKPRRPTTETHDASSGVQPREDTESSWDDTWYGDGAPTLIDDREFLYDDERWSRDD
ncbi:MAG: hypothetical protein KDD73_11560 [Anaerolineales bacterium]|nr:hypothetical protein [Anaerolineales bacterium]